MSKYTLEHEKKYQASGTAPLNIIEYYIYRNENDSSRFLVPKVFNYTNEVIPQAEFEIAQFNKEGETIRKANYIFKDLNANSGTETLIQEKIRVDEFCVAIKGTLIENSSTSSDTVDVDDLIEKEPTSAPIESEKEMKEILGEKDRFKFRYYIPLQVMLLFILSLEIFFSLVYP